MENLKEEAKFKPTLPKPMSVQSKAYEKNFSKTMHTTAPDVHLSESQVMNEVDAELNEAEQSLKKKIFSLAKMEALVFSDPKLSAVYDQMSVNGEEKYGYHYNETIQNMIFNDYVLNSPKYLQKYKMAIPKEKERRDKSGINQLKKAGVKKMTQSGLPKQPKKPDVEETTGAASSGAFSAPLGTISREIKETTSAGGGAIGGGGANQSGSGAYYTPTAWGSGDLMKSKGKAPVKTKPQIPGGQIIQESNYLIEAEGFERFIEMLNEEDLSYQEKLGKEYQLSHNKSNHGLGVSEIPTTPERDNLKQAIDANTELYVGQDVDRMPTPDVKILHNDMVEPNSMFPHPKNPNLPDDGVVNTRYEQEMDKNLVNKTPSRQAIDNKIVNDTSAFTSDAIKHWDDGDIQAELNILKTGEPDKANLTTMEESKKIQEKSKSAAQQRLFGMAHAVQKGELSPDKVGGAVKKIAKDVSPKDVEDFASTKHKNLPEKVDEDQTTMANASKMQPKEDSMSNKMETTIPIGTQQAGGAMNEDFKLLEELNNELNAYSIHHEKLMKMSEERKPSALVLRDRVGAENEKNFKSDMNNSDTKQIIDVEKELEWKDQQTDVPSDPQKLGQDIEKQEIKTGDMKSGESLKNVGDSTNDKGDEVPKRNLTTKEQEEVNMYRNGQHSLVYDNEPSKRFEDRMKKDMGEDIYKMRQDQLKFKGKAPMYNKEAQPVQDTAVDKVQFDKEQSGWNEREGLKETMITGRFHNALNKRHLIDFTLNEVKIIMADKLDENLFELDFTGLGNTYNSKSVDNKVSVNEGVVNAISEHKFYTDGKNVFAVKNPVQKLNESVSKNKPVVNEQMDKMKHLLGYKPETFTNTNNVKKNRGF
jgi:hypothetical protein